jgi:hypothetical protein
MIRLYSVQTLDLDLFFVCGRSMAIEIPLLNRWVVRLRGVSQKGHRALFRRIGAFQINLIMQRKQRPLVRPRPICKLPDSSFSKHSSQIPWGIPCPSFFPISLSHQAQMTLIVTSASESIVFSNYRVNPSLKPFLKKSILFNSYPKRQN